MKAVRGNLELRKVADFVISMPSMVSPSECAEIPESRRVH
jgi:hypothetical protein